MLFENILFRVGRRHLYGEQGDIFKTFDIFFLLESRRKGKYTSENENFPLSPSIVSNKVCLKKMSNNL